MFPPYGLIAPVWARFKLLNVSVIWIASFSGARHLGSGAMEPNAMSTDIVMAYTSRHIDSRRHSSGRDRQHSALPALVPTRVASLIRIFQKNGHSKRVSEFMVKNLRPSSIQLYEAHWSAFSQCCQNKDIFVYYVRSHHFSRYLQNYWTVIYYQSQLLHTGRIWLQCSDIGIMIQQSILTSRCLMRSYRLARPVGRGIMLKVGLTSRVIGTLQIAVRG